MQWPFVGREAELDHSVDLVGSGTGIAIVGPAGVGKSRLLHEIVDWAASSGLEAVTAVASESTRSVPLAPFVQLLHGGPTHDRLALLGSARAALEARSSEHGLLLAIDDAQLLDETSLALLTSTVASGRVTVALTARTGKPMEADLVDLWTDGRIERLDLGPLDRDDARRVLEARLGSVSPELEDEVWRFAAGNSLVTHELIEGAIGESIRTDDDGVWIAQRSIAESPRLSDLVGSRLSALPEDLVPLVDIVALGAPLPYGVALAAIGDRVAELEERSLAVISGLAGERVLVPAHPLYGEVLRAQIGEARRRDAYRKLVAATLDADVVVDPLRVAIWQRDSGSIDVPDLAIGGAREALVRHDPDLAEQLLRPLSTEDHTVALLLGRALSYGHRFSEADELLAGREPADPVLLAEIASVRAQNMGFGLGDVASACALLERAAARIDLPDVRARLRNERAMVSAIHGDFSDALAASDAVLSDSATSVVSRGAAYVTLTVALAMTGDTDRMDEIAADALRVSSDSVDALPFARDQVEVMCVVSLINAGRLDEAATLGTQALEQEGRGDAMTTTWLSSSAMVHELRGELRAAARQAEHALGLFAQFDPFGLELQTRGLLGVVRGQLRDPPTDNVLEGLDDPNVGPRLTLWMDRGRAWSLASTGNLEAAARVAAEGGRRAIEGEHFAWAAQSLLDAARLGHPDLVADDISKIDTSRGSHLLAAFQDFVEAAQSEDRVLLARTADRFAGFGANLLAAEAYAWSAGLEAAQQEPAAASRHAAQSMALQKRCEGAATPALDARPNLVTPRELEVAVDAADGLSSPQISECRYISVRTVDNHLSSIYRKLGIGGREELAEILGPAHR